MSSMTFGCIPPTSISAVISELCTNAGLQDYVYITCIDSSHGSEMVSFFDRLSAKGTVWHVVKSEGLLVRTTDVPQLLSEWKSIYGFGMFNGFDECRFLSQESGADVPLNETWLTSELPLFEDDEGEPAIDAERVSDLFDWMKASDCDLCLGDGCGLNYAAYSIQAQTAMLRIEANPPRDRWLIV